MSRELIEIRSTRHAGGLGHNKVAAMSQPITLPPGARFNLADFDAGYFDERYDQNFAEQQLRENSEALADLGYRLYAEDRRSLLLILQGMDTAGKDGTIRSVMSGLNPQSCSVTSFKRPSAEELDHDFLWRIHKATPRAETWGSSTARNTRTCSLCVFMTSSRSANGGAATS